MHEEPARRRREALTGSWRRGDARLWVGEVSPGLIDGVVYVQVIEVICDRWARKLASRCIVILKQIAVASLRLFKVSYHPFVCIVFRL